MWAEVQHPVGVSGSDGTTEATYGGLLSQSPPDSAVGPFTSMDSKTVSSVRPYRPHFGVATTQHVSAAIEMQQR